MTRPVTSTSPSLGTRLRRRIKATAYSLPGRDRWQQPEQVLAALDLRPGMRVMDVGAGGGYFTFRLADAVGPEGRVYAVDTDPDMLSLLDEEVRRRDATNVVAVDAEPDDPQVGEPVDLAIIVDALHHLPDPVEYLRTLAGHLADDGRLAIVEPLPTWWLFGHATDPAELRSAAKDAGYEITADHGLLPRQSFVVARPTG